MKTFVILVLTILLSLTDPVYSATPGVLIYAPFPGATPKAVVFSDIVWQSASSGSIQLPAGSSVAFKNNAVEQIVYLDEKSWQAIDSDRNVSSFRTGVKSREVVLPIGRSTFASDEDLVRAKVGLTQLDALARQFPDVAASFAIARTNLEKEMANYTGGQKKLSGAWLSPTEYAKATGGSVTRGKTLVTRDGKRFDDVSIGGISSGKVSIMHGSGAATVLLTALPDDLSCFTPTEQQQIKAERDRIAQEVRTKAELQAKTEKDRISQEAKMKADAQAEAEGEATPKTQDGAKAPDSKLSSGEKAELKNLVNSYGKYWQVVIKRKLSPQDFPELTKDGKEAYEVMVTGLSPTQYRRRDIRSGAPTEEPQINMAIAMGQGDPELALLVTTRTSFQSKGKAEVLANVRSTPVKVTMDDGFAKDIPVLLEIAPDPAKENRIQAILDKTR